jgi:hypothetical protein
MANRFGGYRSIELDVACSNSLPVCSIGLAGTQNRMRIVSTTGLKRSSKKPAGTQAFV